jgi:hypothetical protein
MKRILIAVLVLLPVLVVAQSETKIGKTSEERAQQWSEWMQKELIITTHQKASTHEINLKYARQSEELKNKQLSKREKFKALKKIDKEKDGELKLVLTEEQFKVYQQKKVELQRKMLKAASSK